MASSTEIAKRYFAALNAHDLDAAAATWKPGGLDRIVGQPEMVAPDGIRRYFSELFEAFPDFRFEILDTVAASGRCAVRWQATATFAGPGRFQGFAPNHARVQIEGCDIVTVSDGLITDNVAYMDSGEVARQLGLLPPVGSPAEARLAKLANVRTRVQHALHGAEPEAIAPGVWVLRGGRPRTMNVYLIADEGGVTVFDGGISEMGPALAAAGARLGGIRRVVLGHADADHRGAIPALDAPVLCHPRERAAAESDSSFRDYWHLDRLPAYARAIYPKLLTHWDGGRVKVTDTVEEDDQVAGFRVIHLPGHAPGLIGLFREEDRLALVSDCFYTVDPVTGRATPAQVPHPAFNQDTEQARASIRKLAALDPSIAWAGHTKPVAGDVLVQLERAASAPV
ncbi:MAG TPA: ester cyclase [Solirubrobacteraceae bacterium]|jgi:glyoxylase-like metal-dependent hydrolase (beta-lactamase superfamily II)/predicted ester cyclase|nr:ester cyclase [Solirubrobacteraceae bacterium]